MPKNKTYFRMFETVELAGLVRAYDLDKWEPAEVQALCAVLAERIDKLLNDEESD